MPKTLSSCLFLIRLTFQFSRLYEFFLSFFVIFFMFFLIDDSNVIASVRVCLISKASVWLLIWVLRDLWMRSSAAMIEHVFLVCVVAGPAGRFGIIGLGFLSWACINYQKRSIHNKF